MYHELAAILPRCAEYQGKFQSKIPDKFMTSEFVEASNFLSKHYKIKLTRNPFASLGEYLKLIYALYKNKSIIKASRETVIREAKIDLRCKA